MIDQRWCTIDGKSWTLTQGDWLATVYLCSDEKKYSIFVKKLDPYIDDVLPAHGYFNCIKTAKSACIEVLAERVCQEDIS